MGLQLRIELAKHRLSKTLRSEAKEARRLNTVLETQIESHEQVVLVEGYDCFQLVSTLDLSVDPGWQFSSISQLVAVNRLLTGLSVR